MANELVKLKDMELLEQEFNGDIMVTVKLRSTGRIYVGLKLTLLNIGLTEGQYQSFTRKINNDLVLSKGIANLQLPTKGGNQVVTCVDIDFLPLLLAKISITPDMRKNKSDVVEKLVEYQLRAKDVLAEAFLGKKKEWNLQREVGKVDRKRMTDSIKTYHENPKFYTYSNYTDMIYNILFNMTAKQIRECRNINKKSELTRDYLTNEELKLVDEAETIVTGLTALGFKFDYIKDQLERKYIKKIESI